MSRTFTKLLLSLLACVAMVCPAQTLINPVTQINWPLITGAGTPTALGLGCTSVNYGQPFQNTAVTPNTYYTCGTDGWAIRGGGGGGGAGITIGTTHVADGGSITNAPGFNSATASALASNPATCQPGQYQYGSLANGNALCAALPSQPGQQYIAPQALSGCGVEYVSGLTYTVGACSYNINNVTYNSPLTNITLPTADPTNPEIDVIYVDASQTVQVIQGTPAVTPQQPTVDPSTQLPLTFVLVPASATTPGNTTRVDIYLEGVEWTPAKGGTSSANVNLTSPNNPYQGSVDVEFGTAGTVTTTTFAGFTVPSAGTVDMANYNNLVLYIQNKAAWPSTRSLVVQWFSGATAKGSGVVISNGAFGFNALTNTTGYQQISIPTSTFGIAGVPVTSVRVTLSGTGAALTGFYMDDITLQGGTGGFFLPTTLVNFRGTWSSTTSYAANDMVLSGGVGYVALAANTNVAVTTTATWGALGAVGGNTTSTGGTANVLAKFSGANSIVNSLFSDNGTIGAYTGSGGILATSYSTNGSSNGFVNLTAQGTPPSAPSTNTVQITVPNSVPTPYAVQMPNGPPPDSTHTYFTCSFANPSICTWGTGGGGGGATQPYPVVVNSGDSEALYSSTAPHINTTGNTSCDGTTCTTTSTNPYTAGQWVMFDNNGPGGWGCMAFSTVQVLSSGLSSSQFKFSEAQTLLPTYAGCTGVIAPFNTGGLVQDSDTMYGQTAIKLPALSANGTAVPTLYPYAIPGNTIVADAANFSARFGAVAPVSPHGALIINNDGLNDFDNCESPATMEAAYQSFWTQAHAANYDTMQVTQQGGLTNFSGGITCSRNQLVDFDTVFNWMLAQKCTSDNGTTACWDYLADSGDILKDSTNILFFNNHPTPAANAITASIINQAVANASQVNYAYAPGGGANVLRGAQVVLQDVSGTNRTLGAWGTSDDSTEFSIRSFGSLIWAELNNASHAFGTSRMYYLDSDSVGQKFAMDASTNAMFGFTNNAGNVKCGICFSQDPTSTGASGFADTLDLGAQPSSNTSPAIGATTGALGLGFLKLHNWTSDPSSPANGWLWYNSTSNQLKAFVNGSIVCVSGSGCGSVTLDANTVNTPQYVAGGGTANAQTATLSPAIGSYSTGLHIRWKPSNTNTGATTLAINGLTATSVTKCGTTALAAGDLFTGVVADATYDGTQFQLLNPNAVACTSGSGPTTNQNLRSVGATFNGNGSALTGTTVICTPVNYSGTIQGVTLISDVSGSATVDVKTVAYSSYTGPSSTTSITASDIPALSSAVKYQDTTLTGWSTNLTANTMVCFQLSSPATVTWVSVNLKVAAN